MMLDNGREQNKREILEEIQNKSWTESFKQATMSFYEEAFEEGLDFSTHGLSRLLDRARGYGLSRKEVIETLKS